MSDEPIMQPVSTMRLPEGVESFQIHRVFSDDLSQVLSDVVVVNGVVTSHRVFPLRRPVERDINGYVVRQP